MSEANGKVDRIAQLRYYEEIKRHVLESGDEAAIRRLEAREREGYDETFWQQEFPAPSEQLRNHLEALGIH